MLTFNIPDIDTKKDGIRVGPCSNEKCGHNYCRDMRKTARLVCEECGKKIGYETDFCSLDRGIFSHVKCITKK